MSPQLVRIGAIFTALTAVLALVYVVFLREDYVILYDDLRPEEAAAAVAVLNEDGIRYRLRRDGSQIQVAQSRTGEARLAIAGSEAGRGGLTGFELFDDSDMGLTDFAQKIKYQRALQGELARTILMMEGIEQARVHIVMPERTLFRGNGGSASAAVTIIAQNGFRITPARIEGIQRLVAASVPDLSYRDVVVLDSMGEIISPESPPEPVIPPDQAGETGLPAEVPAEERRIRDAVAAILPDQPFAVTITPPGTGEGATSPQPEADGADIPADPRPVGITTQEPLSEAVRSQIESVLAGQDFGDGLRIASVTFGVQPVRAAEPAIPGAASPAGQSPQDAVPGVTDAGLSALPDAGESGGGFAGWLQPLVWIAVAVAALIALGLLAWRRLVVARLTPTEHEKLAALLRRDLRVLENGGSADAV